MMVELNNPIHIYATEIFCNVDNENRVSVRQKIEGWLLLLKIALRVSKLRLKLRTLLFKSDR